MPGLRRKRRTRCPDSVSGARAALVSHRPLGIVWPSMRTCRLHGAGGGPEGGRRRVRCQVITLGIGLRHEWMALAYMQ